MRKLIVLIALTSILMLGGSQQAWARGGEHEGNDDYRTFKKIVHVLDAVVNDDHQRGGTRVVVQTQYYPRRVCRIRRYQKICYNAHHGHGRFYQARCNDHGYFYGRHNGHR